MESRYEVIIWDGCAEWRVFCYLYRSRAREQKKSWLRIMRKWAVAKIWDRKLRKFVY